MEQPTPEHKDWTWVLEEICAECGYDASAVDPEDVAALMRSNAASFRAALGRGDIVHERPPVAPGASPVWSALEYGAHVRDVYKLTAERLTKMLKKKAPTFADWDQNEAADLLDKVRGDQWQRAGMRSDGAGFTIATFAVYMLHDVTHHLVDVERGYEKIIEARKKSR
jgi:hypothetical protein